MVKIYECDLPDKEHHLIRDPEPQIVSFQGRKALRLSGQGACLLRIPDMLLPQGQVVVDIASEGRGFPGIAFRIQDDLNYELAYVQPHTSGKWDAIQYDPVFHGSNTWQLYHGLGAQQAADIPIEGWFRFRVGFKGYNAIIQVGKQEPFLVNRLAHKPGSGLVGLWTYRPAYFSNLEVYDDPPEELFSNQESVQTEVPGVLTQWYLEGFGQVVTESSGILNLNRYLPINVNEVRLLRDFEMLEDGKLELQFGFSDELILQIDGQTIYEGQNMFKDSPNWEDRGYVSMIEQIDHQLNKGSHRLTAVLKSTEFFGYGIILAVEGDEHRFIPVQES